MKGSTENMASYIAQTLEKEIVVLAHMRYDAYCCNIGSLVAGSFSICLKSLGPSRMHTQPKHGEYLLEHLILLQFSIL